MVFSLTLSVLQPMIHHTRGEHATHCNTDALFLLVYIMSVISEIT
jgi:hypothetical protein